MASCVELNVAFALSSSLLVANDEWGGGGSGEQSPPGLGHSIQEGSGGQSPLVYKCTAYKGGPGACPRFSRLG